MFNNHKFIFVSLEKEKVYEDQMLTKRECDEKEECEFEKEEKEEGKKKLKTICKRREKRK